MEILLLDELAADAQAWLAERYALDWQPALAHDTTALHARLYKTRALIVPPEVRVDARLLDFAPLLAVAVSLRGEHENIDEEACARRNVRVVRVINANVRAGAEYQLLNLLTMLRNGAPQLITPGEGMQLRGREINDSAVGLLGMTPTVHLLAPMLRGLGARVLGYDSALHRTADLWQRLGVQPVTLPELLAENDALAVQMVCAARHKGMLSQSVLSVCRPGQFISSISSPDLFDLDALAQALRDNRLGACVLDVARAGQIAPDSPLRLTPRLRITPGMASATQEALLRASWYVADRLHQLLQVPDTQRAMLETVPAPL